MRWEEPYFSRISHRDNALGPWELRIENYRVFYELADGTTVKIVAIGYKEHNDLFIRGRRVQL